MAPKKIIVGVHGIGDQVRNETIQMIARQFCKHYGATGAIPLGRYHSAFTPEPGTDLPKPFFLQSPPDPPVHKNLSFTIGFSEVYWADIPRRIVRERYTLEQAKSWANTVVERLRVQYEISIPPGSQSMATGWKGIKQRTFYPELSKTDFAAIKAGLSEMIDSLAVLESLSFLAEKTGIFSFDLKELLDDYLGDVQVVTEFDLYRDKILDRFRSAMRGIHQHCPDADIYIIAHSEGTVVSFLAILEALCSNSEQKDYEWLQQVRGFMTIGSPIDKHIVLWPRLWDDLSKGGWRTLPENSIKWRNYYDFGDPVGYELDTARRWLVDNRLDCFEFIKDKKVSHDIGFSRYPLPGKAHVDYWDDQKVFDHFIGEVIENSSPEPPVSSPWAKLISNVCSYLLVALLLFGAVFILYKSADDCLNGCRATSDCLKEALSMTPCAPAIDTEGNKPGVMSAAISLTLLLAGLSVASRLPRLTRRRQFYILALLIFALCAKAAVNISGQTIHNLGNLLCRFARLFPERVSEMVTNCDPAAVLLATSFGILLLSWSVKPSWGKRTLLAAGTVVAVVIVATLILSKASHGPLWPVVVAMVFFFYLWWLAILLFDLIFIWHRYIRSSAPVRRIFAVVMEKRAISIVDRASTS